MGLGPSGITSHFPRTSRESMQSAPGTHLVMCSFLPLNRKKEPVRRVATPSTVSDNVPETTVTKWSEEMMVQRRGEPVLELDQEVARPLGGIPIEDRHLHAREVGHVSPVEVTGGDRTAVPAFLPSLASAGGANAAKASVSADMARMRVFM